jgi:hypothetical protein
MHIIISIVIVIKEERFAFIFKAFYGYLYVRILPLCLEKKWDYNPQLGYISNPLLRRNINSMKSTVRLRKYGRTKPGVRQLITEPLLSSIIFRANKNEPIHLIGSFLKQCAKEITVSIQHCSRLSYTELQYANVVKDTIKLYFKFITFKLEQSKVSMIYSDITVLWN